MTENYGWTTTSIPHKGAEPVTEVWPIRDLDFVQVIAPQIDYFEFVKSVQSLNLNQGKSSWHTAEQDLVPVVKPER